MSARNKKYSIVVLSFLIISAAVLLTCSDKILNSDPEQGIEFEIALKTADGEQLSVSEIVTNFRVKIVADEDTITAGLAFSNGLVTGLIENVPAGPNRTIIVEGLADDGTVLYRGSVVIDVIANQTVDAEVILLPIARLVRVSPNYSGKSHGEKFSSDIKVNNITGLTGIELALDYNSGVIQLDSLKAGSNVPVGANFSYSDESGIEISLSHSSSLTDSAGNVTVARAFFRSASSNKCLDSTLLDLGVQSLIAPGVSVAAVYVDDGKAVITSGRIKVSPDTLRFGVGVEGLNLDFKQVSITDSCGNALPFTLSTEEDWIDLNTAVAGITPGTAYIDVDTTGLESGNYEGFVLVNSPRAVNSPYYIVVKLTLDKGVRTLNISPGLIVFNAAENGTIPASRTIHIEELYQYNISFSAFKDAPWMSLSKTTGTTPDSVIVSINTTALSPGTYVDTVVITSGVASNSPRYVRIHYVVSAVPKFLDVIPDTLYFSAVENEGLPASQNFRVLETGGYNINFSATESALWLNLSGISGTTPDTITASISSTEIGPGIYNTVISVSSEFAENSPQTVAAIYTLEKGPRTIAAEPTSLHFSIVQDGEIPESKSFQVFETGGYSIDYSAFETAAWFSITGANGTTPDSVTVSINSTDLPPGMYRDSIEIVSEEADNSPIYVIVTMGVVVGPKYIAVEPDSLHFEYVENSEDFPTGQFRVFETSGYVIPYSIFEDIDWLSLEPTNGLTEDTISLLVQPALEPGIYVDTIVVSSEAADNESVNVIVSLEVIRAERFIAVEPDSIRFTFTEGGDDYPTAEFRVYELEGYVVPYSITENVDWLFVLPTEGLTEDFVTIYTSPDLETGVYVDSIQISSDEAENSPVYVKVSLEVFERLKYLVVEPDSLYFEYVQYSDAIPTGHFNVSELNGYQISFEAVENSEWIFLHNISGTTPDDIDVTVDISLEPGTYVDSVMISSGDAENSPLYVKIVNTIIYAPHPAFLLNPDTLYFEAVENSNLPDSQSFNVSINSYPIPRFQVTESIPWLAVGSDTGDVSSSVGVHIISTDLEPAVYFDSIRVSQVGEREYDPVYEYVVYTVSPYIDSIPPSAVTDLKVNDYTNTSALLSWTSSGDDSAQGTAAESDLRYSTSLETLLAWDNATQVDGGPAPQIAGSEESFNVTNLTPNNTYYFALDIIDDAGNHSGLSNVDSVYLPPFAPDAPILIAPEKNSTGVVLDVTFIWHSADRADVYELEYDTDGGFSEPYSFSDLSDTTLTVEPLDYKTTYHWRVRASNNGGTSDWSEVWSFTTVPTPPTIKGVVKDIEGQPLSEVTLDVYDTYPTGNLLATTQTGVDGYFSFFALSGSFDLYAFKSGYYPQASVVEAPDTNVLIFLLPTPTFSPSDQWVDLFCDSAYSHGVLIQPNDVIEAYDPEGVLCGQFIVHTEGAYGFMHVYRDEPTTTEIDEGCVTGDAITLKVNGEVALPEVNLIYPSSHQLIEACLNVTGENPKWLEILKPAGGETFYQDSSVSVEWSSTGISGPVEIALLSEERAIYILDTSANDGTESVTIPVGIENGNNWQIRIADLDENTGDLSEQFTISSVEILVEPSSVLLHGVVNDCIFDQKQFTISERNGFNIPYIITDTVSWLSVTPTSGTAPALITVRVLANVLPSGFYESELQIYSTSAVNSPALVSIELENSSYLCGDFNNDCQLKISDLTNLVNFLYRKGPGSLQPDALNVDLCDGIDIGDIDQLNSLIAHDIFSICEGAENCTSPAHDQGAIDSLGFVIARAPSAQDITPRMQLDLYLLNDANEVNGLAAGFDWDNGHMILDSAIFSNYVEDSLSLSIAYDSDIIDSSNANNRFLFAANKTIFSGIQPKSTPQLLASYYFTLSSWQAGDSVVVDTLTFNQGTTYKTVSTVGSYQPAWRGPVVIKESGL